MMDEDNEFWIKEGDTRSSIEAVLEDSDGNARNLTGAQVKFYMATRPNHSVTKIDGKQAVIINASEGKVRYDWDPEDTDEVGDYDAEWEVSYASGEIETFPSKGYNSIFIAKDL